MQEQLAQRFQAALEAWYNAARPTSDREPDRYVVCAGLAVLELAREKLPLAREDFVTPKNQVKKTGGPSIQAILRRYGEERRYASEGGRTTRATVPAAAALVEALNGLTANSPLAASVRIAIADELQRWLVTRVADYFSRQKIEAEIDLSKPGPRIVSAILAAAEARGGHVPGAVAQHLVGAKLALRYPELSVENHSYSTADQQLGRPGDFVIRDTVFHVTVAPGHPVIDKCALNLRHGYRAVLLVPEDLVPLAVALPRTAPRPETREMQGKYAAWAIELFVGQNVEEIGGFAKAAFASVLHQLLQLYNERVALVETDRSLLIEVPENLA